MSKRITLSIEGMECPNCAMKLESLEETLDGVLRAEASYRKSQLIVEFNEDSLSETKIHEEVCRLGYQVRC